MIELCFFQITASKFSRALSQNPVFTWVKLGNRRNIRSRILGTPSPNREENVTQVKTPNPGNVTLTNSNVNDQESLGCSNSENQLTEPAKLVMK